LGDVNDPEGIETDSPNRKAGSQHYLLFLEGKIGRTEWGKRRKKKELDDHPPSFSRG
jgi:hypothetical protein